MKIILSNVSKPKSRDQPEKNCVEQNLKAVWFLKELKYTKCHFCSFKLRALSPPAADYNLQPTIWEKKIVE
jgi:hypothetical protein